MKKSVNTLSAVKTLTNVLPFELADITTASGKPAIAIITDKRLSLEDFKALMADFKVAEGFGFTKYLPEFKGSFICVSKITDKSMVADLAKQYEWAAKVAKEKKATPTKTPTTKKEQTAKKAAKEDIKAAGADDIAKLELFMKLKAQLGL